jgi:putative ATP-dependent endonuclease of the OLD family
LDHSLDAELARTEYPMKLQSLTVKNFRGIREGTLNFRDQNVLLGSNNVGKSTIAAAIVLLLGRVRSIPTLTEYDFWGAKPIESDRIRIEGILTGFKTNDPTDYPEIFHFEQGGRPYWWNPNTSVLSAETDPKEGEVLAVKLGFYARIDRSEAQVSWKRIFINGDIDPFVSTSYVEVPSAVIRKIGLLYVPAHRQWDKLLSFSAASFISLLREYDALPAESLAQIQTELQHPVTTIESDVTIKPLIDFMQDELRSTMICDPNDSLAYRVTELDSDSILKSLAAHVAKPDVGLIPASKQGSGFISVQSFLIQLAIAEKRKSQGESTIFVIEEPELHLHPSLHSRLIQRLRACSSQSIVTTHSPEVARRFRPVETMYARKVNGKLSGIFMLDSQQLPADMSNQVRKLYQERRADYLDALLGRLIVISEGMSDWHWLRLFLSLAEQSTLSFEVSEAIPKAYPAAISLVPVSDANMVGTAKDILRFRDHLFAIVDGDRDGKLYAKKLAEENLAKRVVQWPDGWTIEDVVAAAIEPLLTDLTVLSRISPNITIECSRSDFANFLRSENNKMNWALHEHIAAVIAENPQALARISNITHDVVCIFESEQPQLTWTERTENNTRIFVPAPFFSTPIHSGIAQ